MSLLDLTGKRGLVVGIANANSIARRSAIESRMAASSSPRPSCSTT
jgi:enoyl-[acyl-carrier-protein] reductase (NADH)